MIVAVPGIGHSAMTTSGDEVPGSPIKEEPRSGVWIRLPAAWRYAAAGILLGLGAPGGALLLRILQTGTGTAAELRAHAFFYLYELIGTCTVFGAAGYLAGRRADRLRQGLDRYQSLSQHDDLTRLLNARAFREHYGRAIEHARKFGESISLLLLDIDSLKEINDRGGHLTGNDALLLVAGVLAESKRAGDLACRWGGDEFAILMPGADSAAAARLAQTILDRLRSRRVRGAGAEQRVSVTIGVATGSRAAASNDLFEIADRALYEGKRLGRDRFRLESGSEPPPGNRLS